MKNLLFLLLVLALPDADKFLSEVELYQRDSYFKTKVYAEHTAPTFFALKEVNQPVDYRNYDLHLLNAAVFFATNQLRERKNLKPLLFNSGLRDAAVVHTYQMVSKKFFDHLNNRTRKLRTPDDRLELFVQGYSAGGENIDYNHVSLPAKATYADIAKLIVDDFFQSPPHKKNMMSKNFNSLGCAAQMEMKPEGDQIYFKATQDFCFLK